MEREVEHRHTVSAQLRLHTDALNASANAVVITDTRGKIIWANSAFSRLCGYSLDEVMGQSPCLLKSGCHDVDFYKELWKTVLAGNVWHGEITNRRKNGELYTEEMTITPVRSDQGVVTHFIAVKTDVTERKSSELSLLQSEASLRSLIRNAPYGIFRSTEDGSILSGNPAFCEMLGCTSEADLRSQNLANFYRHPEDRAQVLQALRGGGISGVELEWKRKDQTPIVLRTDGHRCGESAGQSVFEGFAVDVTENRRAEKELRRLNRALSTLSKCNEALVRAENESQLLHSICELLIHAGGHRMAWVGYAENDGRKTVRPVAIAGTDDGYVEKANVTWAVGERGTNPAGIAVRTGRVQVVRDISQDVNCAPWLEEAIRRGYSSMISLPLRNESSVFGVVTIHSAEKDAFDRSEVELLKELASDLAYGIMSLRNAEERERAEQQLRESEQRYRGLFLCNPHPMFVFDVKTQHFVDVNDAALAHYGYSREEFLTLRTNDIRPPEDIEAHLKGLSAAKAGYQFRGAFRHKKKDGSIFEVEVTSYRFIQGDRLLSLTLATDVSDRKRAEAALRRSEARYRNIIQTADEGVLVTDRNRQITIVNPRAVEVLGYDAEEMLGKDLLDIIRVLHKEQIAAGLANARQGAQHMEHWTEKKDGTPIFLVVNGSPIFDEHGNFDGWLGMLNDRTEAKKAEEALQISEERFHLASLATHDVIWDWDIKQDEVWFSSRFWKLFGHDRNSFPKSSNGWAQLVHPDDTWVTAPQYERYTSNEYRLRRADGSWAHVLDRAYLICDENGDRVRKVGTISDVSEAKEAQRALRESEARYRTLFEQEFIGVFYSAVGRVLDCNEAMCRMFGYSREEMLEIDVLQLYESAADRNSGLKLLFEKHQLTNYEIQLRRKDGSRIIVLANLTLVEPKSEPRPVIAGVLLDITHTRALQEQLLQSQKLEAVGRLTGGIAHDFNNILMIISSYGEVLLETLDPENPLREFVEQIRTAVDRGSSLTKQLLAFSRKQVMSPVVVDISTVLSDLRAVLRRILGEVISVEVTWDDELWPIKVDPSQIEQVIINLAVNARDAMPKGGRLSLKASNVTLGPEFVRSNPGSRTGEFVSLTITDTGCGIPKELQARVFEPFFTTKGKGKGTGLGLSTVYGIVKQSEGYIRLESDEGHGASFCVFLPRTHEALPTVHEKAVVKQTLREPRLLLVEDEAATRTALTNYLEQNGFEVTAVSSAEEALEIVSARSGEPFDSLLTDVVLPGLNGVALARSFAGFHPNARIIFMSGYTEEELVHSGISEWAQAALIYKPFRLPELVQVLTANKAEC